MATSKDSKDSKDETLAVKRQRVYAALEEGQTKLDEAYLLLLTARQRLEWLKQHGLNGAKERELTQEEQALLADIGEAAQAVDNLRFGLNELWRRAKKVWRIRSNTPTTALLAECRKGWCQ